MGGGRAIRRSGVDRGDLFVTSKLRGADHGRAKTRDAVSASLDRLGLDYLDLYLIHWPLPRLGLFTESYETMPRPVERLGDLRARFDTAFG
jgi:2,5-diketo-D-gluconate reductase A